MKSSPGCQVAFKAGNDRTCRDCADDLLFAVRPLGDGNFVYEGVNPSFESRLEMSSQEIWNLEVSDCIGRKDAESVCEALQACLAERTEIRIRHRLALGGSRQNIETRIVPIIDSVAGVIVRLIGSHRILDRKSSESAIQPKAFSLASIQEDIQQRIASELHDSTCQHLIAASLGLMRIRTHFGALPGGEQLCDEIDASLEEALREIRALTYLLHPQSLTIDGLKATIEQYARGFATRASLQVSTRIPAVVDRLPYESQRSLLRVVQEGLTNVFRHAKATEVKIAIDATDGRLRLTIRDNGRGFPLGHPARGGKSISIGVGIPAMRARVERLGGRLDIQPDPAGPGHGTTLCAVLPYDLAVKDSVGARGH
ncbi:ATP-binding protein [Bradyrhizobium sp. A5]|uniref:PAS domain-containing sensor histidine kinase n=1 Tax=Bradyrhizobium sp. A5 TaxID=3133696 RepID=UPI00325200F6